MRSPFALTLSLFIAALASGGCGGSTTSDLFNDASTGNDSSTGKDSSTGNDSSTNKDSAPDVRPPDCKKLINDVANARDKARECSTVSAEPQCSKVVQDLCCPISVTDLTKKEVQEFVAAVAAVKTAGCPVACPATPCPAVPSNKCDPQTAHCL